jgi:hypothetical protein
MSRHFFQRFATFALLFICPMSLKKLHNRADAVDGSSIGPARSIPV